MLTSSATPLPWQTDRHPSCAAVQNRRRTFCREGVGAVACVLCLAIHGERRHFAKVSWWPCGSGVSHFSRVRDRIAKANELKELGNKLFKDDVKGALRQYHFAFLNIK